MHGHISKRPQLKSPLSGSLPILNGERVVIVPAREVREQFQRVKPLQEISVAQRGWTLDVLTAIRSLNQPRFTNEDIYALAPHFEKLHPGNRHVRDKIRQQLQVLRDLGLLLHIGKGAWRL